MTAVNQGLRNPIIALSAAKDAVKTMGIPPGQYLFPCCTDHAKFKDPAFKKEYMAATS